MRATAVIARSCFALSYRRRPWADNDKDKARTWRKPFGDDGRHAVTRSCAHRREPTATGWRSARIPHRVCRRQLPAGPGEEGNAVSSQPTRGFGAIGRPLPASVTLLPAAGGAAHGNSRRRRPATNTSGSAGHPAHGDGSRVVREPMPDLAMLESDAGTALGQRSRPRRVNSYYRNDYSR